MERWQWEELVAQVEDHGFNVVEFYLGNSDEDAEDYLELSVENISYEDGLIKVVME